MLGGGCQGWLQERRHSLTHVWSEQCQLDCVVAPTTTGSTSSASTGTAGAATASTIAATASTIATAATTVDADMVAAELGLEITEMANEAGDKARFVAVLRGRAASLLPRRDIQE